MLNVWVVSCLLCAAASADDTCKNGVYDKVCEPEVEAVGGGVSLGALYDIKSSLMFHSFNLYSTEDLKSMVEDDTTFGGSTDSFKIDGAHSDKEDELGVNAQIKIEALSGLVMIQGSCEYVRDDKETSDTIRFVTARKLKTRYTKLRDYDSDADITFKEQVCKLKGPTHYVQKIFYGKRAYMLFDSKGNDEDHTLKIHGAVKIRLDKLNISAHADVKFNSTEKELFQNVTVKFYGDTILKKVPTTMEEAAQVYQQIFGADDSVLKDSPLSFKLVSLKNICGDDHGGTVIKVSDATYKEALENVHQLKQNALKTKSLLQSLPGTRFPAIAEPLVRFLHEVESLHIKYSAELAKLIPLVRAKRIESSEIQKKGEEIKKSKFYGKDTDKGSFLYSRDIEVANIENIVSKLMIHHEIVVSDSVSANDNTCIFKKKKATVFTLYVLSDPQVTKDFFDITEDDKYNSWKEKNENNGPTRNNEWEKKTGISKQINTYVEANLRSKYATKHCYMIKVDLKKHDPYLKEKSETGRNYFRVQLFNKGEVVVPDFNIPEAASDLACDNEGSKYGDGFQISYTPHHDTRSHITGLKVNLKWSDTSGNTLNTERIIKFSQGSCELRKTALPCQRKVLGLHPYTEYSVTVQLIVKDGHGVSVFATTKDGESNEIKCKTLVTSQPVPLTAHSGDDNSLKITWGKPSKIADAYKDKSIKYEIVLKKGTTDEENKYPFVVETEHTVTGIKAGETYHIKVTPIFGDGANTLRGEAAEDKFLTSPDPPALTTKETGKNNAKFSVELPKLIKEHIAETLWVRYVKWNDTDSDSGREIQGTEQLFKQRLKDRTGSSVNPDTITLSDLAQGTTYRVTVKLLVRVDGRLLASPFSTYKEITTDVMNVEKSSQYQLDKFKSDNTRRMDSVHRTQATVLKHIKQSENECAAMEKFDELNELDKSIKNNLKQVQQKANVMESSGCIMEGYELNEKLLLIIDNKGHENNNGQEKPVDVYDCLRDCIQTENCLSFSVYNDHNRDASQNSKHLCGLYSETEVGLDDGMNNLVAENSMKYTNLYCYLTSTANIDTWDGCTLYSADKGYYVNNQKLKSLGKHFASKFECVKVCRMHSDCKGIVYHSQSKECFLAEDRPLVLKEKGERNKNAVFETLSLMCLIANKDDIEPYIQHDLQCRDCQIKTGIETLKECIRYCYEKDRQCNMVSHSIYKKMCKYSKSRLSHIKHLDHNDKYSTVNLFNLGNAV